MTNLKEVTLLLYLVQKLAFNQVTLFFSKALNTWLLSGAPDSLGQWELKLMEIWGAICTFYFPTDEVVGMEDSKIL